MRRVGAALTLLVLSSGLVACGDDDGRRTVTVYAAASLTASFEQLEAVFEDQHDGVDVELNLGGSADLVAQVLEGAPADVFASADLATMEKLTAEGLAGQEPQDFATNVLQIVTPPDNPAGIETLADLADPGVRLVVCAPEVPCGAAAAAVAEDAGLTLGPVSEEQSVSDVLGKVTSGEADAGLVYVTDVRAAGDAVLGIAFPEAEQVVNTYPIATIGDSDEAELAADFVALVLSEEGRRILADAGFGPP